MSNDRVKNIPAVIDYLDRHGWKISKSAAYKHKSEGKLRPGKDGQFTISAIEKYADRWLQRKDGTTIDNDELQKERAQAELDKIRAQALHWDTKTKIELGQYVPREEWDRELAARASVFRADIENFIRSEAANIIRLVDGNQEKAPDLIDYYLRHVEAWLDRYSHEKKWKVAE